MLILPNLALIIPSFLILLPKVGVPADPNVILPELITPLFAMVLLLNVKLLLRKS